MSHPMRLEDLLTDTSNTTARTPQRGAGGRIRREARLAPPTGRPDDPFGLFDDASGDTTAVAPRADEPVLSSGMMHLSGQV